MNLCYTLAGVAFIVFPSHTLHEGTGAFFLIIWHIFLILGSFTGLIGGLIRRPAIEAIGIPLLCAALLAYSLVLFVYAAEGNVGPRLGVGLLIFASFVSKTGRFIDVYRLIRIADDMDRKYERRESRDDD